MVGDGVQDSNNCTSIYLHSRSEETENSVAWSNCTTIYLLYKPEDSKTVWLLTTKLTKTKKPVTKKVTGFSF